ncbi:MAG: MauE/DoxX family redox-associated membrane protein [Flavobacteriales bacterium]
MKIFITACRILVGSLFIVSGLIKVNDVIGFGYKLEEYFAETALNFPSMIPYVIPIAIFIVIGEVLLGVALLLGAWPKLTSSLILFMTVFFLWLTNYTASCIDNRNDFKPSAEVLSFPDTCVETCGCFGDAIPLEPRESFWKDVILLIFVIPVFIAAWRKKFHLNTWTEDAVIIAFSLILIAAFSILQLEWNFPIYFTIISCGLALLIKKFAGKKEWLMAVAVLLICGYVQCHTYFHLPLKDYRGYAIGKDINQQIKSYDELQNETAFAKFVDQKITPLTGDTIDFFSTIGDTATVDSVAGFLNKLRASNSTVDPLISELMTNKQQWKLEIDKYQPTKNIRIYTLKKSDTGEIRVLNQDQYTKQRIWEDKTWVILTELNRDSLVRKGYDPPIKDFNPLSMDESEVRSDLLSEPKAFWMISKDITKMNKEQLKEIVEFSKLAQADGYKFYAITPSGGEEVEQFRFENQIPFEFLQNDGTELKIIIRANPGLVYLEKGVVVNMWSGYDIPDYSKEKGNGFRP